MTHERHIPEYLRIVDVDGDVLSVSAPNKLGESCITVSRGPSSTVATTEGWAVLLDAADALALADFLYERHSGDRVVRAIVLLCAEIAAEPDRMRAAKLQFAVDTLVDL